jgi:hypothetical protein
MSFTPSAPSDTGSVGNHKETRERMAPGLFPQLPVKLLVQVAVALASGTLSALFTY